MGPMVILVIVLTAVLTASGSLAWGQWMEHRRRVAAMEVIKAALAVGKDAPREVLDEIARAGQRESPWAAVVAFTALAVGFWIAFATAGDSGASTAFLTVAATMSVTALGLLILALMTRRGASTRADR